MEKRRILGELQEHLPFSIFFTAAGIILAALLTYSAIINGAYSPPSDEHAQCEEHGHLHGQADNSHAEHENGHDHDRGHANGQADGHDQAGAACSGEQFLAASGMMFHILHPIHLLLSAMATTAMFFRFEKRLWKAIIVGFVGAVGVCGLSDVFMPYLCGRWLALQHMHFHWCLLAHPQMVLPFVALGILSGLAAATTIHHSTVFSHSAHVLTSSTASLFYLISFGVPDWFSAGKLPIVFAVVVVCVTIPCCLSDILFPLMVANGDGEVQHQCCAHAHD